MQAMYHIPFLLWMVPYGGWRKCSTYDGTRAVVCMVLATWWCLQVAVILPTVKFGAGRHSNSNPPVFLIQHWEIANGFTLARYFQFYKNLNLRMVFWKTSFQTPFGGVFHPNLNSECQESRFLIPCPSMYAAHSVMTYLIDTICQPNILPEFEFWKYMYNWLVDRMTVLVFVINMNNYYLVYTLYQL